MDIRGPAEACSLATALVRIRDELSSLGYEVTCGTNFNEFARIVETLPQKKLSQQFDEQFFDLHQQNAFWVAIKDSEDSFVSVQAARIDEIGSMSHAEFWQKQQSRIYPKPNRIGSIHASLAKEICGRVCYHGDFYVQPDLRGQFPAGLTVFFGFLIAAINFDPDWIYGLMGHDLAMRGFFLALDMIQGSRWELVGNKNLKESLQMIGWLQLAAKA